jgi:hypothetical protein
VKASPTESASEEPTVVIEDPNPNNLPANNIWTYNCEIPVQLPESFLLTCGDGGWYVYDIKWQSWTSKGATGTGTYSQNMCEPNCAEGKRVEVPVRLRLSELFEFKGRNVLKNLDIKAVSGRELPDGTAGFTWDVAEFAVKMNWE